VVSACAGQGTPAPTDGHRWTGSRAAADDDSSVWLAQRSNRWSEHDAAARVCTTGPPEARQGGGQRSPWPTKSDQTTSAADSRSASSRHIHHRRRRRGRDYRLGTWRAWRNCCSSRSRSGRGTARASGADRSTNRPVARAAQALAAHRDTLDRFGMEVESSAAKACSQRSTLLDASTCERCPGAGRGPRGSTGGRLRPSDA
jgi:hypothetical protein